MKLKHFGTLSAYMFTLGMAASADAALLPRLDGQAVYDTDLDITWIANANLAASNSFGLPYSTSLGVHPNYSTSRLTGFIRSDGNMNLPGAWFWIDAMNADGGTGYLGFNDWRLPTALVPDPGCANFDFTPRTDSTGYDCTGSEMGHLFYDDFMATRGTQVTWTGNPVELAKFTNVQSNDYWSDTEDPVTRYVYAFHFLNGQQYSRGKSGNLFAWAVRSGDVLPAVPLPGAVWLFGSGVIGLFAMARRKKI